MILTRGYIEILKKTKIIYLKSEISYNCIDAFERCCKSKNDKNNKIRENIIGAIINKKIPEDFYKCEKWNNIKEAVFNFLKRFSYKKIEVIHKGGRKYNYDFDLMIDDKKYKFEYKYNCSNITECPQFVSPMNPSKYLNMNFEEFFYDNYLDKIIELTEYQKPDKKIYLKEINQPNPPCMIKFKELYKKGLEKKDNKSIDFMKKCRKISEKSIVEFLKIVKLDTRKLSKYLFESQKDKHFMLYKDGKFHYDKFTDNKIFNLIDNSIEIKGCNFLVKTENNQQLEIKLRWKNYNGLAFPAFQIQKKEACKKIPTKKELIQLCKENNLSYKNSMNKNILVKLLTENNINF